MLACLCFTLLSSIEAGDENSSKKDKTTRQTPDKKLGRFPMIQQIMEGMTQEDRDKLFGLHRENPNKFREEMRKRIKSYRKTGSENELPEIQKLVNMYHKANSDSERLKIESQIKEMTRKQFEKRMRKSAKQLESLEKKVKQLRGQIENREKYSQTIIDNRVSELLKDPNLKW